MEDLLETLKINEEIAQKFFEIEISILAILNFRDLFEKLLTEIREKFGVPYVWISMIDQSMVLPQLSNIASLITLFLCWSPPRSTANRAYQK